jgi:tetratricopeptide (TPR) repeat protein
MVAALALYAALPFAYELGVESVAAAAAEETPAEGPGGSTLPKETRKVPAMSEPTYKKLTEAQEALDAKNYQQALTVLNAMLSDGRKMNGNEIGQVNNILGFVHFTMENYPAAIKAYEQVLAQGEDIPEGLEVQTLYTLAQLSFVNENYDQALRYMQRWLGKAQNPGPDPHIFMGQVYYQKQDFKSATQQIELGMKIARERNMEIKEQWLALLNFLYYEQENWPKVFDTLEELVVKFPKREYWIRLAGIHGQEGNDKESLWTYEAASAAGFLTEQSDLTNYAGLLMQAEVPIRAAKVLDEGIKKGVVERNDRNLQSLGQAYQMAQETKKAIPIFEDAAKRASDGKIYERLAALYLDNDEFDKCTAAAKNAIDRGGLRKVQTVRVIQGMCFYNKDDLATARQSFQACQEASRRDNDQTNQRICSQWITYIDNESNRRAQLAKAN